MKNTPINQPSKIISHQLANAPAALLFFCRLLQLTDLKSERLHIARSTADVSWEIFIPRERHTVQELKMMRSLTDKQLNNSTTQRLNKY